MPARQKQKLLKKLFIFSEAAFPHCAVQDLIMAKNCTKRFPTGIFQG